MFKLLSWAIAIFVLMIVLCGAVHSECRAAVFADTLAGLFVGLVHGFLHVYCIHEMPWHRKSLTMNRVKSIILHHLRTDMVVGLLIGVGNGLFCLCAK